MAENDSLANLKWSRRYGGRSGGKEWKKFG
jgi:hypothetical protein